MNILWIASLTILVALEKMLPRSTWLSTATGMLLISWGACVLAGYNF